MNTKNILVSMLLKIEVCIPFFMLDIPFSFAFGAIWAFVNTLTEDKYKLCATFGRQVKLLTIGTVVNAIFLAIAMPIGENYFKLSNNMRVLDIPKVEAAILLAIFVPFCILLLRIILLPIDRFLDTRLCKNRDELK